MWLIGQSEPLKSILFKVLETIEEKQTKRGTC